MASSALRQALNKQDDVLGPWVPGRDPLEDALAAYAGTFLLTPAAHLRNDLALRLRCQMYSTASGYVAEQDAVTYSAKIGGRLANDAKVMSDAPIGSFDEIRQHILNELIKIRKGV